MVTYREQLHKEMLRLAANPDVRFVGYNTAFGPKMNGTLVGCEKSCIEMPVAENLMCGVAMGLSLKGFLPVLCFERFDFVLACADALVNHIGNLQEYGLVMPMIIRICVGMREPLDPGLQHTMDHCGLLHGSNHLRARILSSVKDIQEAYGTTIDRPWIFIEYRRMYDK